MNSIKPISESQALSHLFTSSGSLSHKEQLAAEERCNERLNSLKAKAQRAKLTQSTADNQIQWAYDQVTNYITPSQVDMVGYLSFAENQFNEVTISHPVIAHNILRNEKTVDRGMKELRNLRLAFSTPRFVKRNGKMERTSNRTWLHPIFRHPKLREMLKGVTPFFAHAAKQIPRFLSLWLLFSHGTASLQSENVPGEYRDIYKNTSRGNITLYEENHLLSPREGDIQLRELTQEDTHSRDEVPMESLSQKIAEMRQQLEPQRAAQKALKADAAREISQLLQGRVTATINLSAKGQFHMLRYCDGAMLYGLECLSKYGTIDNRTNYRLFESACIEYSKKNEIKVDADKYDKLLKDMGYYDSQPFCNKITLDEPLSKNKALAKVAERVEAPNPTAPARTTERNRYASLDPSLKDPIIALALRLGYEDTLNLPQISNQTVDLKE